MRNYPKIGLALGSGSARGLAHLGVLKVLKEHDIPVDMIAGSSIGALIGAFYAQNPSIDALHDLVYRISDRKLSSLIDITIKGGIIKGLKIEKLFEELFGDTMIESLQIPFAAVATDISNADTIVFKRGSLTKALRASIAIPGFVQPLQYDERILGDGGMSEPIPADAAHELGADLVIGVNLDTLYDKTELVKIPSLASIPSRTIHILRHHLALKSTESADVTISPLVSSGMIAWRDFFTKEKLDEFIAEGERAAREALPELLNKIKEFEEIPRRSVFSRVSDYLKKITS